MKILEVALPDDLYKKLTDVSIYEQVPISTLIMRTAATIISKATREGVAQSKVEQRISERGRVRQSELIRMVQGTVTGRELSSVLAILQSEGKIIADHIPSKTKPAIEWVWMGKDESIPPPLEEIHKPHTSIEESLLSKEEEIE